MIEIQHKRDYWQVSFKAMASPCSVLVRDNFSDLSLNAVKAAVNEIKRIEEKYSRYRSDNLIYQINNSKGLPVVIDSETYQLLEFAHKCFLLSEKKFDITSGVLRKVWKFSNRSESFPEHETILKLIEKIGFDKVTLSPDNIILPDGMEIDLGGIAKEYAADRAAQLLAESKIKGALINLGGDIVTVCKRDNIKPWKIAIENPRLNGEVVETISIQQGAVATSGNSRRYLSKDGKRYGHILNPKTGYPVENAPLSITVLADTCSQAGMASTFAMLEGDNASSYLEKNGFTYWCF